MIDSVAIEPPVCGLLHQSSARLLSLRTSRPSRKTRYTIASQDGSGSSGQWGGSHDGSGSSGQSTGSQDATGRSSLWIALQDGRSSCGLCNGSQDGRSSCGLCNGSQVGRSMDGLVHPSNTQCGFFEATNTDSKDGRWYK